MMNKTTKQEEEKEPTIDVASVLKENGLQLLETAFFRQKKTVSRVMDVKGNCFILKTGRIEPFQIQLLRAAESIKDKLSFKVPTIEKRGEGWILLQEVEAIPLNAFYEERPLWCVEISKKIADDYQLVIQEVQKTQSLGNLLVAGQEWLFSRLNLWSKPIVDAGLIDFQLVQRLKREFEEVILKKGESFFSWVHGNVIGDHVLISKNDVYLLDLNAVPRAGRGYHDFLRALDFMFLKAEDEKLVFTLIPILLKRYLSDFDEAEVRLVFALRNIGVLGWDILHNKAEEGKGNIEQKKKLALKFIKREY